MDFLPEKDRQVLDERGVNVLLSGDLEGPLPAERNPWRRLALCYSAIAFAVVVRPETLSAENDTSNLAARAALYRYLKRVQLTLFEFGLVYPVACIVVTDRIAKNDAIEIERWISDQDWHRGDFTLHVGKDFEEARNAILGLLSLKVERLMDERREPRTIIDQIKLFESKLPPTGPTQELGQVILDAWRQHEKTPFGDSDRQRAKYAVDSWLKSRIADVRRTVEEGPQ